MFAICKKLPALSALESYFAFMPLNTGVCGMNLAPSNSFLCMQGKWKPPMIANPAYKGKWKPRQIENPYFFEPHPYSQMMPISALGIELWTMSADIVFDNVYIGDDEHAAADFAKHTFSVKISQVI